MAAFRTVRAGCTISAELHERRSRFVAHLQRADSESAARAAVTRLRAAYPQARHHCSAFRIETADTGIIERSSDDGEPAGTAGTPMLEVLRGASAVNCVAVVVRWFGGVKLGTGGLVRAYSGVAGDALYRAGEQSAIVEVHDYPTWRTRIPHSDAGRIEGELRRGGLVIVGVDYGAEVTIRVAGETYKVHSLLAQVSGGLAQWEPAGIARQELPVESWTS